MGEATPQATAAIRRLPNRRPHKLIDFEREGRRYTAGISTFEHGQLAEIFVNMSGRASGMVEVLARDLALATPLCLQFGCDVETLRRAPMRISHGRASSPVGLRDRPASETRLTS